jgi:glycerate kinase
VHVVVAPDSFGGTLSAPEAAQAIADGWSRARPLDVLDLVPLSDGGPGLVDVLAGSVGGEQVTVMVRDPVGRTVAATLLVHRDTIYLETSHACGLHLVPPRARDPLRQSTSGVGDLLREAAALRPGTIVAGLGGSGTNDGGAGMLTALGWVLRDELGQAVPVEAGPSVLQAVQHIEAPPEPWWRGDLVVVTDVDNPLLGPGGATAVFGAQKGADAHALVELEVCLAHLSEVIARDLPRAAGADVVPGAGAAGGLGFGMLVLGGRVESGCDLVLGAVDFAGRLADADLVLTGEGSFDDQSLRGKVVSGVASRARASGVPCVVLAGNVSVKATRHELAAYGVTAAWSVVGETGSLAASLAEPAEQLARLAERAARSGAWEPMS